MTVAVAALLYLVRQMGDSRDDSLGSKLVMAAVSLRCLPHRRVPFFCNLLFRSIRYSSMSAAMHTGNNRLVQFGDFCFVCVCVSVCVCVCV